MPPVIEGFTFDGCHIVGPAVVGLEASSPGSAGIANSSFDGEPDAMFIQLEPAQEKVVGVIVLKDCRFDRCRFQGIGFLDKNGELRTRHPWQLSSSRTATARGSRRLPRGFFAKPS